MWLLVLSARYRSPAPTLTWPRLTLQATWFRYLPGRPNSRSSERCGGRWGRQRFLHGLYRRPAASISAVRPSLSFAFTSSLPDDPGEVGMSMVVSVEV